MFLYSTDCNFIVKVVGKDQHFECYTKDQVLDHVKQPNGAIVYQVKKDGSLDCIGIVKPYQD